MKNIWIIFTQDVKKLVRQPFALIIIIGLCIIPALYAWFNIFANWDPYANTGGIPVAVTSLDQDYTMSDGTVVNMGDSVLESLHDNTSVSWVFLDTEDEVIEGVEAGTYYAGIVISKNFTYSMYNVFSDDFENPTLVYYQNQKANAIATKITDTVASTLQTTINKTFIQVAATTIFEESNTVSDDLENQEYVETFQQKLITLNDNLKSYSTMIDSFLEGNTQLEAAITHVNYEVPKMQDKLDTTAENLQDSSNSLSSSRATLSTFSSNIDASMTNINNSLTAIDNSLANTALASDTEQAVKDLNQTAKDINTLNGQVSDLINVLTQTRIQDIEKASPSPAPTTAPDATATPDVTSAPDATSTPDVTTTPDATATPEVTGTPSETETPGATSTPGATATPEATNTPVATSTPETQAAAGGGDGTGTGGTPATDGGQTDLQALSDAAASVADALNAGMSNEQIDAAIKALQAMQKEMDLMNTVIGSVLDATSDSSAQQAKNTVNSSLSNIRSVVASCQTSVTNMQNIYKNQLVPQMESVLQTMSDALSQVTGLINSLSNTMGNIGTMLTGVQDAMNGTTTTLVQIQDVVDGITGKIDTLCANLDGATEEEALDMIISFLGADPDSIGEYFASPVTMETVAIYPVATYGSAMTPFYSTLAIWVGSTVLVALVKVKPTPKGLKNVQSYQLYFGRLLLFWVLGQIQAAIIAAGDLWLIGVNIVEPGLFFLAASFTATAFSLLIYSMTLAFGDVGKAICVIIMVLQIAGSSGTFPIELLPEVYQKIYIFFPFPYAISAMREALAGMYGTAYMEALAKLILFMIAGLLVGLVIRIPFVRINHFVEERMEDTHIM